AERRYGKLIQNFQKPYIERPEATWSLWPSPVVVQNTVGAWQPMYCTQFTVAPACGGLTMGPGSYGMVAGGMVQPLSFSTWSRPPGYLLYPSGSPMSCEPMY